jgi:hypothetical protein
MLHREDREVTDRRRALQPEACLGRQETARFATDRRNHRSVLQRAVVLDAYVDLEQLSRSFARYPCVPNLRSSMRFILGTFACASALVAGCGTPKCPPGYMQMGNVCRHCKSGQVYDAGMCFGTPSDAGDASAEAESPGDDEDGGALRLEGGVAPGQDASTHAASGDSAEESPAEAGDPGSLQGDAATDTGASTLEPGTVDTDAGVQKCGAGTCQHGGQCIEDAGTYACLCEGTGYQGPSCEQDINECAGANVCAGTSMDDVEFNYVCENGAPYYRCVGQFPDWPLEEPMQRFSVFAKFADDQQTGLQWDRSVGQATDLEGARTYCTGMGAGWRLPTRAELASLVKDTTSNPAIDTTAFPDTPGGWFWTSSPFVGGTSSLYPWLINFHDGQEWFIPVGQSYVRCVRLGRAH